MKQHCLMVGVALAFAMSIVTLLLQLSLEPPPPLDLPYDEDILSLEISDYSNAGLPTFTAIQSTNIRDFTVPAEYIAPIMHILRPGVVTKERYFIDTQMFKITIKTKAEYPVPVFKCYYTGQGPIAVTRDHQTYYLGNLWCGTDGGFRLREILVDAYLKSEAKKTHLQDSRETPE